MQSALSGGPDLIHGALPRRLVRAPAQQRAAVPEPAAAYLVVADLDDQLRRERLPFAGTLGAPAAGAARRAPGEARRFAQRLQAPLSAPVCPRPRGRGIADMVQHARLIVIEAEQERSDKRRVLAVTKAADDTIGGLQQFVFLHAVAIAGVEGSSLRFAMIPSRSSPNRSNQRQRYVRALRSPATA